MRGLAIVLLALGCGDLPESRPTDWRIWCGRDGLCLSDEICAEVNGTDHCVDYCNTDCACCEDTDVGSICIPEQYCVD